MNLHPNATDLTGRRFGRLVVIGVGDRKPEPSGQNPLRWLCRCDCGVEKSVRARSLVNGATTSCGCYLQDWASRSKKTHGLRRAPEYRIWSLMKDRCLNENGVAYSGWGGRGVTVCDAWLSFERFYEDMGPRPSDDHELDREDNEGPYSPENCRWVLRVTQANNKRNNVRLHIDGVEQTVAQWAAQLGVSQYMIHKRLKRGWSVSDAVFVPPRSLR